MFSDTSSTARDSLDDSAARVTAYVQEASFPCVGARSAFNRGRARFGRYASLGDKASVERLCADLAGYSDEFRDPGIDAATFIATFDGQADSEEEFVERMWAHLQAMHEHDRQRFPWDGAVSSDPSSAKFSFSIAGRAYFVVGLHPHASRLSRRAPMPCLVFNFHDQFEALRESGRYAQLQGAIRKRDIALQGSINPVLARFGESSEARQYSGEAVDDAWKCPFHALETADAA